MIYIALIIILFLLFCLDYNSSKSMKFTFWLGTFFFLAIFAFRGDNVGGDTTQYCIYFEGKTSSTYGSLKLNDDIEIGFRWICMALQKISMSRFWFIFSTSLLSLIPFVFLVRKHSLYPNLSYLYIICSNWAIMVVCIETHIRQNIATAFLMMALYIFLYENKTKKSYISCVLLLIAAVMSHTSIYLILPLVSLLLFVPLTKKVSYCLIIGSCLVTLFFTEIFTDVFTGLMLWLSPYEAFDNLTRYMDSDKYGLSGKAGLFTSFAPIAIWALINIYYSNKEEINNIFMKCMVVGTSLTIMGSSFGLSFRMMYALLILGYCYIPIAYKNNSKAMLINFIPLLLMLFRLWGAVLNPAQYNTESHWLPYLFIFE